MSDGPRRPANPMRRADDERFERLEKELGEVKKDVVAIRKWLTTEDDQSPLGRILVTRADINARNIEKHDERIDRLESWRDQAKGSLATARLAQVLLAIIVAGITIYQFVGK